MVSLLVVRPLPTPRPAMSRVTLRSTRVSLTLDPVCRPLAFAMTECVSCAMDCQNGVTGLACRFVDAERQEHGHH